MRVISQETSTAIRTIWFICAMGPIMVIVTFLGLLSIGMMSPLIIYAFLHGKHLKDPLRNNDMSAA